LQIINNPPEAGFTFFPLNPSTQDVIQFIDTSLPGCGAIQTWSWEFGDGDNANIQNPTHQYIDDGSYLITLNVIDCQEGTDSASRYVVVSNLPPIANIDNINPNPASEEEVISFYGYGEDIDGVIENYHWESDIDGKLSNELSFEISTLSKGIHEISFKVQDDDGDWSDIETQILEINNILNLPPENPTILGETSGEIGRIYEYTIKSTDPENDDITYCIDWGDGAPEVCFGPFSSGQEKSVNNSWGDEGTYIIKVKAKDIHGAESDWATLEINMPKNKSIYPLFLRFFKEHTMFLQLIQHFLGL